MNANLSAAQQIAVLAYQPPISQAAGTVNLGWLPASKHDKYLRLVGVGVLGASATVDAKIQQATSAAGAGATRDTTVTTQGTRESGRVA